MHFITLTSDYGFSSTYQASLKGAIYSTVKNIQVVDITHQIQPFNLIEASYILKNNWYMFPEGTWHFICVDAGLGSNRQIIVAKKNNHFFIGADNGIFSILFDSYDEIYKVELNENLNSIFIERDVFVNVAAAYFAKKNFSEIVSPTTIMNIRQNQVPVLNDDVLTGSVVYIDGFGNAITNISKELFDEFIQHQKFKIYYSRKFSIDKISFNYLNNEAGIEIALFNSNNALQISVNRGNANQLLGLKFGSPIMIQRI